MLAGTRATKQSLCPLQQCDPEAHVIPFPLSLSLKVVTELVTCWWVATQSVCLTLLDCATSHTSAANIFSHFAAVAVHLIVV